MAKGKYAEWLEPENLLLIHGWKMNGLTDEQIAGNIGIAPRTLERWKVQHSQIRQVLKKGKQEANYLVEDALYKKARAGNTTAMIFWLKNNYREKYSENVTDPKLLKQQIRKAKADADIAEANAQVVKESDGEGVQVNVTFPKGGDLNGDS